MTRRSLSPFLLFGPLLAVVTVAVALAAATPPDRSKVARFNGRTFRTVQGTVIRQRFDPRTRRVSVVAVRKRGPMRLANGSYRLTNGETIKVQGGLIVWDSFGVIANLNAGDNTALDASAA